MKLLFHVHLQLQIQMFDAEDNEETEVVKEYEKDEAAMEESAEKEETI